MAFHEGNFLIIQITDDGNGMDPEKLIARARERGLIGAHQQLNDEEAYHLIFLPGFSTKEQVSEVSGRGVGMDVVKTNIESLGGSIRLQSKKGVGSCIRLMLPLTLAIIDGLLIEAGHQRLVVARGQVHEIVRLDAKDIHLAQGKTPFLRLRESVLPLFSLSREIDKNFDQDVICLVVKTPQHHFAVAIKDVSRQQQVVVKPAPLESQNKLGVMGTTILGDGKPCLIIDLVELFGGRGKREALRQAA
jgi:two-component system chemotaxis sensor kinase CheA